MKKMTAVAALVLSIIASGQALADTGATLEVKASLLPPSCDMEINGGDNLKWDDLDPQTLKEHEFIFLEKRIVTLNITCQRPNLYAIKAADNSGYGDIKRLLERFPDSSYGLVNADDPTNLYGAYKLNIKLDSSLIDGKKPGRAIGFKDNAWSAVMANELSSDLQTPGYFVDLIPSSTGKVRVPSTTKTYSLELESTIGTKDQVTGATLQNVSIRGSATFELVYM